MSYTTMTTRIFGLPGLGRSCTDRDAELGPLTFAEQDHGGLAPYDGPAHGQDELARVVDGLAVELDDHIARLDPRFCGRRLRQHLGDDHAFVCFTCSLRARFSSRFCKPTPSHPWTGLAPLRTWS